MTPRALRVLLFTTVSGTLAISPARAAGDLDGLPLPSRGPTLQPTAAATSSADRHVVTRGESLWTISAQALPPGAPPSAIADQSAAWYERNEDVIGQDADVIHPGQVLVAPEGIR